jgi:chromosome segregation ATPase
VKKLSKEQLKERGELADKIRKAQREIEEQRGVVDEAISELNTKISDYNDLVGEAQTWAEDIGTEARDAWNEKSEKWQEGDSGQAVDDWIRDYEHFNPEVEEEVELATAFIFSAADDLEGIDEEAIL